MATISENRTRLAPRDLVELSRPRHWVKNAFVLLPLLFSRSFLSLASVASALIACACFCLISSFVYIINDVIDAEADRHHPKKSNRPVASGRVSPACALMIGLALVSVTAVIASATLPLGFLVFGGLYLGNSLVYCLGLKHRVIVDVLAIAIGFVLRLLAGCAVIGVEASSWIVVCGFSLALVLGFGKRRAEIGSLGSATDYRSVLLSYNTQKLDLLIGISSSICLMSYMLYTVAPETVEIHGTKHLVYTVPFVAYGIFRHLFKVHEAKGEGPVEILTSDPVFVLNGVAWGLAVATILGLEKPR